MHFTLKQTALARADLDEFVECYHPENRHERAATWSEEKEKREAPSSEKYKTNANRQSTRKTNPPPPAMIQSNTVDCFCGIFQIPNDSVYSVSGFRRR